MIGGKGWSGNVGYGVLVQNCLELGGQVAGGELGEGELLSLGCLRYFCYSISIDSGGHIYRIGCDDPLISKKDVSSHTPIPSTILCLKVTLGELLNQALPGYAFTRYLAVGLVALVGRPAI